LYFIWLFLRSVGSATLLQLKLFTSLKLGSKLDEGDDESCLLHSSLAEDEDKQDDDSSFAREGDEHELSGKKGGESEDERCPDADDEDERRMAATSDGCEGRGEGEHANDGVDERDEL